MRIFEPLEPLALYDGERLVGVYVPGLRYNCLDDDVHAKLAKTLDQWLIEDKAKGQKRQAPPPKPARSNVIDLVAALQESLAQKKSRKARRCLTPIRSDPPPLVAAAAFDIANALHMNGGIGL